MDKKKLAALIASVLLVIGLTGSIVTYKSAADPARANTIEETFSAATLKHIQIRADHGDVAILSHQEEQIKVTVTTHAFDPQIRVMAEDETLVVELEQSQRKLVQLNPFQKASSIKVYVPEQHLGIVRIESDNGRIQVTGLSAEAIHAKTDNGLITLADLTTDQLLAQTNNGKITLENITGSIQATTNVGAITLRNDTLADDVTLTTDIGMIEIKTSKQPTNTEIIATVEVGTISIYGKANENTRFGAGENKVQLRTDVGQIIVK